MTGTPDQPDRESDPSGEKQPAVGRRGTGAVNAIAIAQLDGRPVVVSGSEEGTVRVWDLATGAPIDRPLTGPATYVLFLNAA
jgi:eukaryotic-like serine/threonine-protein kinase